MLAKSLKPKVVIAKSGLRQDKFGVTCYLLQIFLVLAKHLNRGYPYFKNNTQMIKHTKWHKSRFCYLCGVLKLILTV